MTWGRPPEVGGQPPVDPQGSETLGGNSKRDLAVEEEGMGKVQGGVGLQAGGVGPLAGGVAVEAADRVGDSYRCTEICILGSGWLEY